MGRPEVLIQGPSPAATFARRLRDLRAAAGKPSYRQLAEVANYSYSALSKAAAGDRLPTLEVSMAYVRACHALCGRENADLTEWTRHWESAKADLARWEVDQTVHNSPNTNSELSTLAEPRGEAPLNEPCRHVDTNGQVKPSGGNGIRSTNNALMIAATIVMIITTAMNVFVSSPYSADDEPQSVAMSAECYYYWVSSDDGADKRVTMPPRAWLRQEFRVTTQCPRVPRSGGPEVTFDIYAPRTTVTNQHGATTSYREVPDSTRQQLQVDLDHKNRNVASRVLWISWDNEARGNITFTAAFLDVSLQQGELYSLRLTNFSDAPVSLGIGDAQEDLAPARLGNAGERNPSSQSGPLAASIL